MQSMKFGHNALFTGTETTHGKSVMERNTSGTKIICPIITGVLPRKRLFRLLEAGRHRPVIWITGPPGSGKTTLAASYLASYKLPHLWYHVDAGDDDVATFFHYMSMAARRAFPGKQGRLPSLAPEYLHNVPVFTKRYFEELSGILPLPFFVVFDDYQEAPIGSEFHNVIVHGLGGLPGGIHAIVLSRGDPPPQFARLRANNKIHILGWNDIRFTLDESGELAGMKTDVEGRRRNKITGKTLAQLYAKTEGWAAGLVLMLESIRIRCTDYAITEGLAYGEIFDYFATEVFEKSGEETRSFLLKTAFLPGMTSQIAEKLTGIGSSGQILSSFIRNNYFTTMSGAQEPVYRYHPLFKEFLVAKAKGLFPPHEISVLRHSAAALLEESGLPEDAAELLREVRDFRGLARLIVCQAPLLIAQGRNKTLEGLLQSIPDEMVKDTPWLLYWIGACKLPFRPGESRRFFEEAFNLFRARDDWPGILLSWSNAVDTFFHEFEDLSLLDKWLPLLDDFFHKPAFPSLEVKMRVISSRFVSMVLRQPRHPDIEEYAEYIFTLLPTYKDVSLQIHTGFHLTVYYLWTGNLSKAALVIGLLQKGIRTGDAPPLAQLLAHGMRAMYAWLTGSTASAVHLIGGALKLARKLGIYPWCAHILCQGTCAALSAGDMNTSERFLRRMEEVLPHTRKVDVGFYHYVVAWDALLRGNLTCALEHIQVSVQLVAEVHIPFPDAVNRILMAHVLFARGERTKAITQIHHAQRVGRWMKSKLIEYTCLLAKAYFALEPEEREKERRSNENMDSASCNPHSAIRNPQPGDTGRGLTFLRRAMILGRKQGYVNTFGWRPDVMARLCVRALDEGIEVKYVQEIIRRRHLVPGNLPVECEEWPWRLKIYTLGRFEIIRGGRPIPSFRKTQEKPMLMLKALISLGNNPVDIEPLSDLLWPEVEGDKAYNALRTTLHRLRRLIGDEKVIQVRGGQVALDRRYCWVDAWAFEQVSARVESVLKDVRPSPAGSQRDIIHPPQSAIDYSALKARQLAEKAKELYRGDFLPGDSGHGWVISMRERLRRTLNRLTAYTL